ncbi:hypothetical protein HHK36_021994 [Tetracentron sinense]|uniref:Glycosyltransferase n=1 Tax=Tetracentron sinense TaxID=13715 RepID=A0A834YP78_TETSI|nr:hypothetical protein HHK36_021994 [Tetracentron sinense]
MYIEMEKEKGVYRANVLVLPYPSQGHINPMLQFAKRLAPKGIKASLAITHFLSKSMQAKSGSIEVVKFSDGFDDGVFTQADGEDYHTRLEVTGSQTLAELIKKQDSSGYPFDCLVYDAFLPWALDVAKKFGLVGAAFLTQSCANNNIYYHVQRGLLKVPISESPVSLPGLPLLELADMPSFISAYGSYPTYFHLLSNQFSNIHEADWVLVNTFYKLEDKVIDWMAKLWPMRAVGPTSMYLDKRVEDDKGYGLNLFKPSACMNWLSSRPTGSVVYVSFGSMASVGVEQMEELARGLSGSGRYFLWVVRASEEEKLPKNFAEEMSEKGLVVHWCSQLEVLAHHAVGCFVTHCGWNSVLEALSLGVPMVGMPQWTDQTTNAKYVKDVWKTGLRARVDEKGIVRRQEVERCIREVMEGEKGQGIMKNSREWRNFAKEAVDEGGSSQKNIDEFVAKLVCS